MATSLGRSGEIWSSYSASISKWAQRHPLKKSPAVLQHPCILEGLRGGQSGDRLVLLLRAPMQGSCVRNVLLSRPRYADCLFFLHREHPGVSWKFAMHEEKHLLWFQGTLCGCRGWGCDPVLYLKLKNVSEWWIILTNVSESCGKYLWQRKVLPIIEF